MRTPLCIAFAFILLIFNEIAAFSQETPSAYKLSVSGFVRADAIFDSRQVVEAREGFLLFYPKKPEFDKNGRDVNAHPSFNQYAMTTRLTAKATGPDVLGAKMLAVVESDFTGASNAENNSLRLRHAYISMKWAKTRIMAGQYWHPLDVPEMIPNVLSLNTGAPFHSFSRQPQIRLDQQLGSLNLLLVAASQRDYVNTGPVSGSSIYLRNSIIPNLHSQIQIKQGKLFVGAGVDFKRLTPRLVYDSIYSGNVHADFFSYTGFLSWTAENWSLKTQYTLGRALNDHLMMGGFGEIIPDTPGSPVSYSPITHHYFWVNIAKTSGKWQPSFFAGYLSNAGAAENLRTPTYSRGEDIDYIYRLAPMITYVKGNFSFIAEVEYTAAAFGEIGEKNIVNNTSETGNLRVGLGAVYSF